MCARKVICRWQVVIIKDPDHVLQLLDEVAEEVRENLEYQIPNPYYYFDRKEILVSWKDERMLGLEIEPTPAMLARDADQDFVFMRTAEFWPFHHTWTTNRSFRLPCFCIVDDNQKVKLLWRARRILEYNVEDIFAGHLKASL